MNDANQDGPIIINRKHGNPYFDGLEDDERRMRLDRMFKVTTWYLDQPVPNGSRPKAPDMPSSPPPSMPSPDA